MPSSFPKVEERPNSPRSSLIYSHTTVSTMLLHRRHSHHLLSIMWSLDLGRQRPTPRLNDYRSQPQMINHPTPTHVSQRPPSHRNTPHYPNQRSTTSHPMPHSFTIARMRRSTVFNSQETHQPHTHSHSTRSQRTYLSSLITRPRSFHAPFRTWNVTL